MDLLRSMPGSGAIEIGTGFEDEAEERPDWFRLRHLESLVGELQQRLDRLEHLHAGMLDTGSGLACRRCGGRLLLAESEPEARFAPFDFSRATMRCIGCETSYRAVISDASLD